MITAIVVMNSILLVIGFCELIMMIVQNRKNSILTEQDNMNEDINNMCSAIFVQDNSKIKIDLFRNTVTVEVLKSQVAGSADIRFYTMNLNGKTILHSLRSVYSDGTIHYNTSFVESNDALLIAEILDAVEKKLSDSTKTKQNVQNNETKKNPFL